MKISLNAAALFLGATASLAMAYEPSQSFFIPLPEENLLNDGFKVINSGAKDNVVSVLSFSISTDNTVIWYDHWEGGYEADVTKPKSNNTEIWGDGIASNGCAPTVNPCTDAADRLLAGASIVIQNSISIPRNKNTNDGLVLYDGRDMVYSSFPIAITRGAYPSSPGAVMAGAVEVIDCAKWGTEFVAPIGPNLTIPGTNDIFKATEYTALFVMAAEDGTEVTLPDTTKAYLMKGSGLNMEVKIGDRITTNKKVQVHLLTGDKTSDYEMRWFALYPSSYWEGEYLSPVGDSIGPVRTVIYNDASSDIKVDVQYRTSIAENITTETVVVKAKSFNLSPVIPTSSGSYLKSQLGEKFLALTMIDVDDTHWTTGKWFDWGFPVVPMNMLTPQVLIGWGYGCTNNDCGVGVSPRSVVWISAMEDADIYVDYNNTGKDQKLFTIKKLQGLKVSDLNDTRNDMSGALIFATKPGTGVNGTQVDIAAAWGQDPSVSKPRQDKSLDLGTVVLPMAGISVFKTADKNIVSPGATFRYTIKIVNVGQVNLAASSFKLVDNEMPEQTYVPGTTTYYDGIGGAQAVQDDRNGTAFPLDGTGLRNIFALPRRGGVHEVSFDVVVSLNISEAVVSNKGFITTSFGKYYFRAETPVAFDPKIQIENTVYSGQNGLNPCKDSAVAKEMVDGAPQTLVTYCFKVTNTGKTFLKNPIIENAELKSIHRFDGLLAPGQVWEIHYDKAQDATNTAVRILNDMKNTATVTATAVFKDGSIIDPMMLPVKHSDPSEVRVLPFAAAVTIENLVFSGDGDCELNGVDSLAGTVNTNLTYCFKVVNTGNSFLRQIVVTNHDIKPVYTNNRDVVLAPGDSYLLQVPGIFDGNYTNTAIVVGSPALADGTILSQYPKPTHSDQSTISQRVVSIDVRSGVNPTVSDPDIPTKCMTPHWRDAGGKQDLVCRADDITVKSLVSNRVKCKEGESIKITVSADLYFKTGLYDPTWFVATDGGDAKMGTCVLRGLMAGNTYTVTDPSVGGDAGVVAWNSDAIGGSDRCGDVLVDGGSVIVSGPFLHEAEMKCEDTNDDGNLDFSVCFSWRSKSTDGFCSLSNLDVGTQGSLADAFPADNMKCRCVRVELPTVSVHKQTSLDGLKTCF